MAYQAQSQIFPFQHRRLLRRQAAFKYIDRVDAKESLEARKEDYKNMPIDEEDVDDIFHTITQSDIDKARANKGDIAKTKKKKKASS